MDDEKTRGMLRDVQVVLDEIAKGKAKATRALIQGDGSGVCIKITEPVWQDRPLLERISNSIRAIQGVSAVYLEI